MRSQIKTSNKKKTRKTTVKKPFIYETTINKVARNKLGYGPNNPGESKIAKVGKYRFLVTRAERLDYYGNPVYTATLFGKDGTYGKSERSNGNVGLVMADCLRKNGINVKSVPSFAQKKYLKELKESKKKSH